MSQGCTGNIEKDGESSRERSMGNTHKCESRVWYYDVWVHFCCSQAHFFRINQNILSKRLSMSCYCVMAMKNQGQSAGCFEGFAYIAVLIWKQRTTDTDILKRIVHCTAWDGTFMLKYHCRINGTSLCFSDHLSPLHGPCHSREPSLPGEPDNHLLLRHTQYF